jgi:DNA invertase Pin-like site-specific DNA recombinase
MRAALYVRVSTDGQDLAHQEADLRRELERRGWELAGVYAETVSGSSSKRPELDRLRADAAMSRFRAVLVWAIDRLGRNALEVLAIAEELHGRKVGLASFREPAIDTTSAIGTLVLQIGAAFAQFEKAQLSARTKSGMAGARARGAKIGRPRAVEPAHVVYLHELNRKDALGDSGRGAIARTAAQLGVSARTVVRSLRRAALDKRGLPQPAPSPRGN